MWSNESNESFSGNLVNHLINLKQSKNFCVNGHFFLKVTKPDSGCDLVIQAPEMEARTLTGRVDDSQHECLEPSNGILFNLGR